MTNPETEKDQAAYVLSDDILRIQVVLERAETVVQELTDSYFAQKKDEERGRFGIMWEYDRARVHADIVADYMYEIRKVTDEFEKMWMRHVDSKAAGKAERESVTV